MYPLFVATAAVLAARTQHRVLSAGGMQFKHRASERVHGGGLQPKIPSTIIQEDSKSQAKGTQNLKNKLHFSLHTLARRS